MNTDADSIQLYQDLEAELNEMIQSGVSDPEAWFLAGFTVEEAQRWDGLGWTVESVLGWSAELRADLAATAVWLRVGMMDPLDPFQVLEALTCGLLPTSWQSWRLEGFSHESTVDWLDRRFSREDAVAWVESGLPDPSQADEWTGRGFSVAAAKTWRVAIHEVADIADGGWVEVGFSPEEAALARLAGVTRPPALEDRLPGDMTGAIEAGRIALGLRPWAVGYRPPA